MEKVDKPRLPKRYNDQEREFWYALGLEEQRALRELEESRMIYDPIAQSRGVGAIKKGYDGLLW